MNKFISFIFFLILNIIPVQGSQFIREDGDKEFKIHLLNDVQGLSDYKPQYVLQNKINNSWDLIKDCEVTATLIMDQTINSLSKTTKIVGYLERMTIVIPVDNSQKIKQIFLSVHGKGCRSLEKGSDWESLGLGTAITHTGSAWIVNNNIYGYFSQNNHSYKVYFGNEFMTP